jgi:hypothetical protein
MPRVGFEPTIPVFERAKTVRILESAADTSYTGCVTTDEGNAGKTPCVEWPPYSIQRGKGNVTKLCFTSTILVHKYVRYSPFKINKGLYEYILVP